MSNENYQYHRCLQTVTVNNIRYMEPPSTYISPTHHLRVPDTCYPKSYDTALGNDQVQHRPSLMYLERYVTLHRATGTTPRATGSYETGGSDMALQRLRGLQRCA